MGSFVCNPKAFKGLYSSRSTGALKVYMASAYLWASITELSMW